MEILKFPNPSLSVVCSKVTVFGPELKIILRSMWDTLKATKGIGLAANQVGLKYRIFVMEGPDKEQLFFINPVISSSSLKISSLKEGCLSAPGEIICTGTRWDSVSIRFQDEKGQECTKVFKGIHAVCVQHEIEHLNGKNFMSSKYIPRERRKYLVKKWGLKK